MNKQYIFILDNEGKGALVHHPASLELPERKVVTAGNGESREYLRTDRVRTWQGNEVRIYTIKGFRLNLDDYADPIGVVKSEPEPISEGVELNYVDKVKEELAKHIKVGKGLMTVYALLVLVKGEDCTLKDIHDAWAVNINESYPDHRSLLPFEELSKETQEKDREYTLAIRETARALEAMKGL